FLGFFPEITDPDTVYYADLGRNWLQYGVYGQEDNGMAIPTNVRLPGYPIFLASVFAIFGDNQYLPVLLIQIVVNLVSCFLVAAIALEMLGEGAALGAFGVALLCPFTANYATVALTETFSIFFTSLVLWSALKGISAFDNARSYGLKWWLLCGAGISLATLFRPDGVLLWMALGAFLLWIFLHDRESRVLIAGMVTGVVVAGAFAPWTWRNWVLFHEFQPLAPRYCNAPWEYASVGFFQWYKTWPAEFASLYDIFWKVATEPSAGEAIDLGELPPAAFDTPVEREKTLDLFKTLNKTLLLTPELDAQFAALARDRIDRDPIRYYVVLPLFRITDMWLRPRTEQLGLDPHWWRFNTVGQALFSIGYALLNLSFLAAALLGMIRFRRAPGAGLLVGFVVLRSVFLATLENPEPRYVLECYPSILVFAGAQLHALWLGFKAVPALARSRPGQQCKNQDPTYL
ncbi:MAG: glycosyltransferase family 39 protein, partial [Candidatus Competibacteraceae bacterium]